MSIKPVGNRLVVRFPPARVMKERGLYLPETVVEKPIHAIVLAAPEGSWYQRGDEIVVAKFAGKTVRVQRLDDSPYNDPVDECDMHSHVTFVDLEHVLGKVERLAS